MSKKRKVKVTLATSTHMEIARKVVDDPYEPGARLDVIVNVREHALTYMHNLGRITDEQLIAGDTFRRHYETAMVGNVTGLDYSRIRVDGGGVADPLSERACEAHRWLRDTAGIPGVGSVGFSVLQRIAGDGETITSVAKSWRNATVSGPRLEGYISGRLAECLDAIVEHYGLVARGRARK